MLAYATLIMLRWPESSDASLGAVGRACLDRRRLINDLAELDDSARRRVTCAGIGSRVSRHAAV